jgi:hypothetical protein
VSRIQPLCSPIRLDEYPSIGSTRRILSPEDAGGLWLVVTLTWGGLCEILYTYFGEFPFYDVGGIMLWQIRQGS